MLHEQEAKLMIPHLTVEASVSAVLFSDASESPWVEYLGRKIRALPYENAEKFLLNWGISTENEQVKDHLRHRIELRNFDAAWNNFKIEDDRSDLLEDLVQFYDNLAEGVKLILPKDFITKARMVWDCLRIHNKPQEQWSELDKEVKWYSIWHHFFSDYHQAADKAMDCMPYGKKFKDFVVFPDLCVSVPIVGTEGADKTRLVPAIFIENGTDNAPFELHKDTTKVLAETRIAATYSLSTFDTENTFCYGVVNGGSQMSVTMMQATIVKNIRTYRAAFIKHNTNYTFNYSLNNYKDIIQLFVKMHYNLLSLGKYKTRAQPLLFSSTHGTPGQKDIDALRPKRSQNQNNPPTTDSASPTRSTSGTNYSGQPSTQKLCLNNDTFTIRYLTPTTRVMSSNNEKYFVKVMPLGENGSLPNEYQMLMKLDHPHIIKPVNVIRFDDKNECWVLFNGYSTIDMLRRCAYDNASMALGVLEALHYLHTQGIVHADVKSANVMATYKLSGWACRKTWSQGFKPILIDFGLSFHLNNNPNDYRGTRPFVAPEVNEGRLSPAMDMWAYGLYVFDTFFGLRQITQESSEADVLDEIRQKQSTLPQYPIVQLLFDLIWKCLVSEPEKRITSEQALKHPFFYAMKHIKPSYITMFVLGNILSLYGESPDDLTEEEKSVETIPPTDKFVVAKPTGSPLRDITNVIRAK